MVSPGSLPGVPSPVGVDVNNYHMNVIGWDEVRRRQEGSWTRTHYVLSGLGEGFRKSVLGRQSSICRVLEPGGSRKR